ncbi:MAG: ATP synthase subunit I [Oscillospiraceae bacterium]|nr:ATP synthase subunit I [Oscillospiraceae bacterium]
MNPIKQTLRQQLPIFLAQLFLCGGMVGVYAIIGKLTPMVLCGALVGFAVSVCNHLGLILSLLQAEKCESPEKGQLKAKMNYFLRMFLMLAVLVAVLKFVKTDPIATLLPLILMRIALFVGGLILKKEGA